MRHGFIMRHTIHTMFYGGSYFDARRSEKGNFDISGILLLLAFLWCPASDLSYLSSCFREYLKKLARKIQARFDPNKFTQFNLSRFLLSLYLWRGIPRQQLILSRCERLCEFFDIFSVHGYVGFYVGVTHNRTLKITSNLRIIWSYIS